jgi:hypothetical protein
MADDLWEFVIENGQMYWRKVTPVVYPTGSLDYVTSVTLSDMGL